MQPPQIAPFSRLFATWSLFLQCSLQCTMGVAVCSAVHNTHYTLHSAHYTLHTTHCTLHTTHYTVHTTHYTLPTAHFYSCCTTLYTSNWTLSPQRFYQYIRVFEANPPHQKLAVLAAVALLFVKPCMVRFLCQFFLQPSHCRCYHRFCQLVAETENRWDTKVYKHTDQGHCTVYNAVQCYTLDNTKQ